MESKGSLLVFTEVPENCKDAVKLLDLKVPQFAKLLRRIIKKLEKGTERIEKHLVRLSADGSEEKSDFILVGSRESKNSDILFARLPNNEGSSEIYQLPFIRLTVRKTETVPQSEKNTDGDLKDNWKLMVEKLEHIDSGVTSLLNIANKPKRISRPSTSLPNASQKCSKPPPKPIPPFPVLNNVSKPQVQPHNVNKLQHPLDSTIDNVLASIRNGNEIDLGEKMRQKLQIPTTVDHTESPYSTLKTPEHSNLTPKVSRKRAISEVPSISLTFTPMQSTSIVKSAHVKNKVSPKSAQSTTENNNVPWYHGLVETLDHEDVNYYDSSEQTPNKVKKHKSKKQKIQLEP